MLMMPMRATVPPSRSARQHRNRPARAVGGTRLGNRLTRTLLCTGSRVKTRKRGRPTRVGGRTGGEMATINDVAALAGVSVATVSRALNGKATVAPELVARVQAAATELRYHPNGLARSLRSQQTAVLALIISDVANP